jgi:hypothetical protein
MLCAGATGVERFSILIALPTDGSGCLLLNGDFGTSPLYRHLSGGNGPIRRKSGYIRRYLRTHGNIREDTALHTPCPFRVKSSPDGLKMRLPLFPPITDIKLGSACPCQP